MIGLYHLVSGNVAMRNPYISQWPTINEFPQTDLLPGGYQCLMVGQLFDPN